MTNDTHTAFAERRARVEAALARIEGVRPALVLREVADGADPAPWTDVATLDRVAEMLEGVAYLMTGDAP